MNRNYCPSILVATVDSLLFWRACRGDEQEANCNFERLFRIIDPGVFTVDSHSAGTHSFFLLARESRPVRLPALLLAVERGDLVSYGCWTGLLACKQCLLVSKGPQ